MHEYKCVLVPLTVGIISGENILLYWIRLKYGKLFTFFSEEIRFKYRIREEVWNRS